MVLSVCILEERKNVNRFTYSIPLRWRGSLLQLVGVIDGLDRGIYTRYRVNSENNINSKREEIFVSRSIKREGVHRYRVDSGELLSCYIILISAAVPQTRGVQGPASRDCREHVECSFALTLGDFTPGGDVLGIERCQERATVLGIESAVKTITRERKCARYREVSRESKYTRYRGVSRGIWVSGSIRRKRIC